MVGVTEQTFSKEDKQINAQRVHGKVCNITNHQGNTIKATRSCSLTAGRRGIGTETSAGAGEEVGKRGPCALLGECDRVQPL